MKIVRLCGSSAGNIYCLLTPDDWDLGMPEGLAHWNGHAWRWIDKLSGCYSTAMICRGVKLQILDADGTIRTYDSDELLSVAKPPAFRDAVDFREFSLVRSHGLGIVGNDGLFFIVDSGSWRKIETHSHNDLYCIRGQEPRCFVCGANGSLLRFDGEQCDEIKTSLHETLLHLDIGEDGSIFLAGVGEDGAFLCEYHNASIVRHNAPSVIFSVAVISEKEVYCSTTENGVIVWDGSRFAQCLPHGTVLTQFARAGRHLIVGTVEDDGNSILSDPPSWRQLSVTLDESFLN